MLPLQALTPRQEHPPEAGVLADALDGLKGNPVDQFAARLDDFPPAGVLVSDPRG
jgi:hypothetical protein